MPHTARTIRRAIHLINGRGLHTGDQFADGAGNFASLDVCAAIYCAAEGFPVPAEFHTDEDAAIRLIECSAPAMATIRAVSDHLDTQPPYTEIAPGIEVCDYIDHVSHWAANRPTVVAAWYVEAAVVGRLIRIAEALEVPIPTAQLAA